MMKDQYRLTAKQMELDEKEIEKLSLVKDIEVAQLKKKGLRIDLENLELSAKVNGLRKKEEEMEVANTIVDLTTDSVVSGQEKPSGIVEVITHTPTVWQPSQPFTNQENIFSPEVGIEPTRKLDLSFCFIREEGTVREQFLSLSSF